MIGKKSCLKLTQAKVDSEGHLGQSLHVTVSLAHGNRVEWWLPGADWGRMGEVTVGRWGDVGERVQTFSYKVNNVQHGNCEVIKIGKRVQNGSG